MRLVRSRWAAAATATTWAASLLAVASVACGCRGAEAPRKPEWSGPVRPAQSTAADRESVAITVYNSNFGLVREVRHVTLPTGRVDLEFRDVSATLQPETVHVRSMLAADALGVYEQNYRYDLLSPQKLLEKYVGKHVTLHRWNKELARDDDFDAEVLSVEGGSPIFKIGPEITYGFPGRVSFPEVPANLIAKPTLVWLLGNSAPKQRLEVTYLAQSMTWHADYVLSVADDPKAPEAPLTGDLQAWVTLSNQSGASYEHAALKLVAGDVQHFAPDQPGGDKDYDGVPDEAMKKADAPSFKEEGFFEYHLYALDQPTDLLDNEQKQLSLLEGHGIRVDKKLIFSGQSYWYREGYGGAMLAQNQKVGVFLDVDNRENNHLGVPLPKGIVRVYKADSSGAKQFIGEDQIDHTPRDEKLRVKMGEAFDVVADRKQTDWKPLGSCTSESAWEISVRNHKDSAEKVELDEPMGGDWTIVSSSRPPQKRDQQTLVFDVNVPAKGETKVTWRARVRWC